MQNHYENLRFPIILHFFLVFLFVFIDFLVFSWFFLKNSPPEIPEGLQVAWVCASVRLRLCACLPFSIYRGVRQRGTGTERHRRTEAIQALLFAFKLLS